MQCFDSFAINRSHGDITPTLLDLHYKSILERPADIQRTIKLGMQQSTESIEETGERIRNEYEGERAQIEEQCATEKTSNPRAINTDEAEKKELGLRPFKDMQETLTRLEQDDPKLAFQSARLVGLYRRLWESCAIKHVDAHRLKKETEGLRVTTAQLACEAEDLSRQHEDQVSRLDCLEQSLEQVRLNLLGILDEWKEPQPNTRF